LPLVALAFRHRLREETVVALALFLAFNPGLLYYSRFMRGDILAGGFSFLAFACLVRAVDFDDGRYLIAATAALALGFGAKENVLAYLLAFVGAAGLLLNHRLMFADLSGETAPEVFRRHVEWAAGGILRHVRAIAGGVGVFLLVVTAVYVPRGSLPPQDNYYSSCTDYEPIFSAEMAPTLGEALGNPLLAPRLFVFTLGSAGELYACQWITPRTEEPNPAHT
jgi:uncharacterized protein (TIGR03663 family)